MEKLTWKKLNEAYNINYEFEMIIKKIPYLKKLKCKECDDLLEIKSGIILWD